jgi:hypothetical protein
VAFGRYRRRVLPEERIAAEHKSCVNALQRDAGALRKNSEVGGWVIQKIAASHLMCTMVEDCRNSRNEALQSPTKLDRFCR